jgi:hypothetical protein
LGPKGAEGLRPSDLISQLTYSIGELEGGSYRLTALEIKTCISCMLGSHKHLKSCGWFYAQGQKNMIGFGDEKAYFYYTAKLRVAV